MALYLHVLHLKYQHSERRQSFTHSDVHHFAPPPAAFCANVSIASPVRYIKQINRSLNVANSVKLIWLYGMRFALCTIDSIKYVSLSKLEACLRAHVTFVLACSTGPCAARLRNLRGPWRKHGHGFSSSTAGLVRGPAFSS